MSSLSEHVVIEKITSIPFPEEILVGTETTPYVISGTAVRSKKVMGMTFRAYAVGFYVSKRATSLLQWNERGIDDAFFNELSKNSVPKAVRLVLARDITVDRMQAAFEEVLFPRIERLGGKKDIVQSMVKAMIGGAKNLKNNTEIIFALENGTLDLFNDGSKVYSVMSEPLCHAISDLYLGQSSIVPELRETFPQFMPQVFFEIGELISTGNTRHSQSFVTVMEFFSDEEDEKESACTTRDPFADVIDDIIASSTPKEIKDMASLQLGDEEEEQQDDDDNVTVPRPDASTTPPKAPTTPPLSLEMSASPAKGAASTPLPPHQGIEMSGQLQLEIGGFTGPISGRRNFAIRGPLTGKLYFQKWITVYAKWDSMDPTHLFYWIDDKDKPQLGKHRVPGRKPSAAVPLPFDADGKISLYACEVKKGSTGLKSPITGKSIFASEAGRNTFEIIPVDEKSFVFKAPSSPEFGDWFQCLTAASRGKTTFKRVGDMASQ